MVKGRHGCLHVCVVVPAVLHRGVARRAGGGGACVGGIITGVGSPFVVLWESAQQLWCTRGAPVAHCCSYNCCTRGAPVAPPWRGQTPCGTHTTFHQGGGHDFKHYFRFHFKLFVLIPNLLNLLNPFEFVKSGFRQNVNLQHRNP